ncbi:MAG: hypothetical protein ACT4QB_10605 [Gammaproteobacteria bacterium]
MKTVVGLFDSLDEAQSATRDLITAGYSRDDIGLLASDATGEWSRYKTSSTPMSTLEGAAPTSEEMGSGVGTGTVVGGLGGLLVGLTAIAIPGIGWLAAAGTVATTLLGASMGAAAGGLLTAVEKLGVPKDKTGYYAEAVRRGGTLVLVRLAEEQVDDAMAIMERHQAVDIEQRAEKWRAAGWRDEAENPMAEPLPAHRSTRPGSPSERGKDEGI